MQTEPENEMASGTASGTTVGLAHNAAVEDAAAEDSATAAAEVDSAGGTGVPGTRPARDPLVLAGLALAAIAFVAAGYFGFTWYHDASSTSVALAQMRDAALQTGEREIQNLTSVDYRNIDAELSLWQSSTTGDLHNQFTSGLATIKTQTEQAKVITSAKVLDGAVTDLENVGCKATVIVAVEITVTPATGSPTTKPLRIVSTLQGNSDNDGGCSGWKLAGIQQVPVGGATGTSTAPTASSAPTTSGQ